MKKQQTKKIWLIIGVITTTIIIAGGIMMFKWRSEEEIRNQKYETSLVEALKNSYEGIEEIKITNPEYTEIPGDWSCDVEIKFEDKTNVSYRIGHDLDEKQNYQGSRQSDSDWEYLQNHKGKTSSKVKIVHSDEEKGD